MIVATPAQAVTPCLNPNEEVRFSYTKRPTYSTYRLAETSNLLLVKQKMAYPRRMSVYTHIPTENVEPKPIPEPRSIRPLFLQEKYGASFRESMFKNINKKKTLAGCVAAQAEHVTVSID